MAPAGSLHGGVRQDILDQLGNFATMMRYLEGHGAADGRNGAAHPAVSVLEKALPVLQKIMQKEKLQADAEVFSALCEVIICPAYDLSLMPLCATRCGSCERDVGHLRTGSVWTGFDSWVPT